MICTFVSSLLWKKTLVTLMDICVRLHVESAKALSSFNQLYKDIIQVYLNFMCRKSTMYHNRPGEIN